MTYTLLPPNDPRVLSSIAEFDIERFKEDEKIELKEFADNMFETMKKYGGIGLSANQVGLPFRMFVMGGHPQIDSGKVRAVFNPLINDVSEETVAMKEGCLSFPGVYAKVKRPEFVKMRALDINGEVFEHEGVDYDGRCMLHELDHLKGITFFDRLSPLKRKMLEEKYFKRNRERL